MKYYIYELIDPRNNEIRYVGKTNNPKHRYSHHIYCSKHNKRTSHCVSWIKSLLKENLEPIQITKEEFDSEKECLDREVQLISEYRKKGIRLTNLTDGGEGQSGRVMSEETKRKISETKKLNPNKYTGKKRPEYIGKKISASKKGMVFSENHKNKLSISHKGKTASQETKQKMSLSAKKSKRLEKFYCA
jgi:hypothetical protein